MIYQMKLRHIAQDLHIY